MMMIVDKSNLGEDGDEQQQVVMGRRRSVGDDEVVEREHMFDKVVTPSDVGKLNRLVIPKQHAEKYFPLDSSTNEKGLLLNFEDSSGKQWRFRYSYWNSSQSYVMTKGWSRFVNEKKLDAGDIVSFQRGVGEFGRDRLFIDRRRRPLDHHHHHHGPPSSSNHHPHLLLGSAAHHHDHLSLPPQHRFFHRSSNILHPPPTATAAAWNPFFLQQQPLMSPPSSSSSSPAAHYYLQPNYYRDHHYSNASHLLPPPADHSQSSTTATNNGQYHSHPNFHYPNYYNNMIRSTSDHHYTGGCGTTTYHHNQAANPASPAVTYCSGSLINFRSAETAAAAAANQHRQQQEAEQEVGILQHYLQRPGEVIGADQSSSTRVVFESVPVIQGKAAAKRLRLFGVNMDCAVNNTSHFPNSADDDIVVQCDNVNNIPNCGTIISERGMNMISQAPHHNNTSSHNIIYYGSNSPCTATTVLPPPPYSSSAIPYLQLSSYPQPQPFLSPTCSTKANCPCL